MIWQWLVGALSAHSLLPTICLRRKSTLGSIGAKLALTFDDGPDPRYTTQILEILSRHNVLATFFIVGEKALRYPELVRAITSAGHDIGTHSYSHTPPWIQPLVASYREHMRANEVIASAGDQFPQFARAPWGVPNLGHWLAILRSKQTYVHWTVHAYDWRPGITAAEIRQRVLRQAAPQGVVLLHDGTGYPGDPTAMIEALPDILVQLQERFALVPLRYWHPYDRPQEVIQRPVVPELGSTP